MYPKKPNRFFHEQTRFSHLLLPAHKRGDDDAPSSATAVGTRLLGVRMGV